MQSQNLQISNTVPCQVEISSITSPNTVIPETTKPKPFPLNLPFIFGLSLDQHGKAFAVNRDYGNTYAQQVGSRQLDNRIRQIAQDCNISLRRNDLIDINHGLQAQAELSSNRAEVWFRVAPYQNGIELDVGDDAQTRFRVTPGKVEIIGKDSDTLFYRSQTALPMVLPAKTGDINKLKKYLNMHSVSQTLFIAWLSYTMAHPKLPASKFVILVLQGNQGSGKSSLCKNIILALLDPSSTGVQLMPTNTKDLAVAVHRKHVVCFDNVRELRQSMADALCVAATGGAITARQLYTDAEQTVIQLHSAIVLNGIHSFIDQPDLAQRCLPIELHQLSENDRKSEKQLIQELNADLPEIMRGLLDRIASIMTYLPTVEVTNPERMIDFVHWLAAMESAMNVPSGVYQAIFSEAVHQGQLDSLLDNTLAAAMVNFASAECDWSATPAELLRELNRSVDRNTQRDRDWPQNPIALSKRLKPLQASLYTQGINISFTRGKNRTITIKKEGI